MPPAASFAMDRIDLALGEDEIAHYHPFATHFLEGEPPTECKPGFELYAIEGDLEISAREADAVNAGPAFKRAQLPY